MSTQTSILRFSAAILLALSLLAGPSRAEPGRVQTVDDLLESIEEADEGVETIQSDVLYDRRLELQDDRIIRRGTLYFIAEGERRKFAVRFDTRIVDGVPREEDELLIFDGRWFVEKREDIKRFIRREIARKGADFDPLRLGEGPFPIPIGQSERDIRARYEVSMPKVSAGLEGDEEVQNLIEFVRDSYQLHLIPHDEDRSDLVDIRLWYRFQDGALVPRLARTVDPRGDVTYVQLVNVKVNAPVPEDALSVEPPTEDSGWRVQEVRLPGVESRAAPGISDRPE